MPDARYSQLQWRGVQPLGGINGVWPDRNAVRVNESALQEGEGLTVIYEVPAEKKLYIGNSGLHARLDRIESAYARMYVRNAEEVTQYFIAYLLFDTMGQSNCHDQFKVALEAEAGWEVIISSGSDNVDANGFIFGWLEDAPEED